MSRVVVYDKEIGRGRQNDSSSSRESSPQAQKKRSFSPASDDGDTGMPAMADDDTPPPPERPIIRQAFAFGTMPISTAINTYEAALPPAASKTFFLPGQVVPTNPLAPQSKVKSKKQGGFKKARPEYSGQTGRFRLETYDPTPSTDPPIHHGTGPYSSLFRGASGQSPRAESPANSQGGYPSSSTVASHSETSTSRVSRRKQGEGSNRTKGSGKDKMFKSQATSIRNSSKDQIHENMRGQASPNHDQAALTSTEYSPVRPTYYRYDYDSVNSSEPTIEGYVNIPSTSETHPQVSQNQSMVSNQHSSRNEVEIGKQIMSVAEVNGVKKIIKHPLRIVTLLIQDIRSGVTDHQLVEVKVPLRTAENPQDGYWADAKELIENWQRSPARVDGPAKVYTLRGKYRQFFLRVTSENVDEYNSTNIVVNPDRTVDVVVENLLPPGAPPPPPQIPRDLLSPSPEVEEIDPEHLCNFTEQSRPWPAEKVQQISSPSRKRRASPSFDTDVRPSDARVNQPSNTSTDSQPLSPSSGSTQNKRPNLGSSAHDQRQGSAATRTPSTRLKVDRRGYDSPLSDDEADVVHKAICKAVDILIQKDGDWKNYFKSKAKPPTASNMVTQYQFVKRMMDKFVGQVAPFRSKRDFLVEKSHITGALLISDDRYSSDCTETLELLEFYGKGGNRCEDSGVIEILNDNSQPPYNAKPIKRLLHMLRDVDARWKSEHVLDPTPTSSPSS